MSWLKRNRGSGAAGAPGAVPEDSSFLKAYPALWEFVSLTAWEDGAPRKTGSLLFFLDDGRWKCCLSDKENSLVSFVSGESFQDLLRTIDKGIQADKLDWRKQRPFPVRKGS